MNLIWVTVTKDRHTHASNRNPVLYAGQVSLAQERTYIRNSYAMVFSPKLSKWIGVDTRNLKLSDIIKQSTTHRDLVTDVRDSEMAIRQLAEKERVK